MDNQQFLPRAWPDMCAAYQDTAVAQACLTLQQAFSVDVPLLLVLCLGDLTGRTTTDQGLSTLVDGAGTWRDTVVAPLRNIRQHMKPAFTATAETALRDAVKRLELEAERLHVMRLVSLYPPHATDGHPAAPRYLAQCGLTTDAAQDFIDTFAAAQSKDTSHE